MPKLGNPFRVSYQVKTLKIVLENLEIAYSDLEEFKSNMKPYINGGIQINDAYYNDLFPYSYFLDDFIEDIDKLIAKKLREKIEFALVNYDEDFKQDDREFKL